MLFCHNVSYEIVTNMCVTTIDDSGMYASVGIVVPTFAKNIFHIALPITASLSEWFLKLWIVTFSKGSHQVLKNYLTYSCIHSQFWQVSKTLAFNAGVFRKDSW